MLAYNRDVAGRLDALAQLLAEQHANPFRVRAYERGAATVRALDEPVDVMFARGGLAALEALPAIGPSLARAIASIIVSGRLPMLDRLQGEADPVTLLCTVPGIGRRSAERLHDLLGIESLEALEVAAHDGRLAFVTGFGPKRLAGVRDALAQRLGRLHGTAGVLPRPVEEILDVDAEYRRRSADGTLPTIAPRRLNPNGESWLPVLHTRRGETSYSALYSNTPNAHRQAATRDWVVVHAEAGDREGQWTVITARWGPLAGRRVVRGREPECLELHRNETWATSA